MLDGQDGLDTKFYQLLDGSEMHTGESVGEAWRTDHDQLLDAPHMQAGEKVGEAGGRVLVRSTKNCLMYQRCMEARSGGRVVG